MSFKKVAVEASKAAGKIHLEYFNKELKISTKETKYDRLTIADIEAEKKIVSIIRKNFPEHNILAEEKKYKKTNSPYLWIVDPLDGTNNYSHALPIYSVSIAVVKNDDVILGCVFDPSRNELFFAEKGKGSTLNGKKITVSQSRNWNELILITGFYYDRGLPMLRTLDNIRHFLQKGILGIRRLGSAALDLCYVACGRADGFWEFYLNPWDFAAGKLIVEEAGGRVTDKEGKKVEIKPSFIVASNNDLL